MNLFAQNSHLSYNEPIVIEPVEKTPLTKNEYKRNCFVCIDVGGHAIDHQDRQ